MSLVQFLPGGTAIMKLATLMEEGRIGPEFYVMMHVMYLAPFCPFLEQNDRRL